MRKTTQFRRLLHSDQLEFILEAHNGLSARICEEAGFKGVWASGLCLSSQFGVRDSNEASWTQVLEMLEFMADATTVPILLDGDTGYGNFNNMQRLVRKLEQRQIAAVCIEDKIFPKTNSFLNGESQPLADMDEFCGKIKAGKDAQLDDDFCIIARVEALIAGRGMKEAMRRAEAYQAAGADAILIHSAMNTADEVLEFKREWGDRHPVVIVPTKYFRTPTEQFRTAGFSLAIWANHLLRASLLEMQRTARILHRENSLASIEPRIAPLSEVFRLQGVAELKEAEARFLPQDPGLGRAIVLAASRGSELGDLTSDRPKTMVEIEGEPILGHIVSAYARAGVQNVTVVRGYHKETVALPGVETVDNDAYKTTGELYSLKLALANLGEAEEDLYISYGDVLFHRRVVDLLVTGDADITIPVDTNWKDSQNLGRYVDYITASAPPSRHAHKQQPQLTQVGPKVSEAERHGEWMGFLRVAARAVPRLREAVDAALVLTGGQTGNLNLLLEQLVASGPGASVVFTTGNWSDIDDLRDVVNAGSFQ